MFLYCPGINLCIAFTINHSPCILSWNDESIVGAPNNEINLPGILGIEPLISRVNAGANPIAFANSVYSSLGSISVAGHSSALLAQQGWVGSYAHC